jgi:hypothetical protein
MDAGTINLLNRVAEKGPALPKNAAMIYKGSEVDDINLEGVEGSVENDNTKIIQDLGASTADYYDPIEPDEEFLVSPDPQQQLEQELSGAVDNRGEENSAAKTRSERMSAAAPVQENGGESPVRNSQVPEAQAMDAAQCVHRENRTDTSLRHSSGTSEDITRGGRLLRDFPHKATLTSRSLGMNTARKATA